MTNICSTSALGLELLEHYEGCKLEAYQDQGGVWTIGIGTTRYPFGKPVQKGDTLESRQQAIALMEHDLKIFEVGVAKLVNIPLDQNEFDSLVVLTYNIGIGALKESTIRKKINFNASVDEIEKAWMMWVYDNGKVINGLINRRKSEFYLYKNGVNKFFNQ